MRKTIFFTIISLIFVLVFSWGITKAQTSQNTIGFRTGIVDQDGKGVNDGIYSFRFMLFSTQSGGSPLWSETHSSVAVRKGFISVSLGSQNPFDQNIFLNNSDIYLQVCWDANKTSGDGTVLCGGGFEEEFRPRRKINASAFAFRARNLGPANINTGETAYEVITNGSSGNIFNFKFNNADRLTLSSAGVLNLTNGANTFGFSTVQKIISLPSESTILFGSLQNIRSYSNYISILTNNIDRFSVTNAGNVGIGTSSPTGKLEISGGSTVLAPSTTDYASMIINSGTNPTAPVSGALWWNGTNLNFRGGAITYDLLAGIPCSTCFVDGGNTFGANATLGLNDNFDLSFETNATQRARIFANGSTVFGSTTGFNSNSNLFGINASDTYARTGGSFNLANLNLEYTPSSNTGSEEVNSILISSVVNAGDNSNMLRYRGIRSSLTNNTNAPSLRIFGNSGSVINTQPLDMIFGTLSEVVSSSNTNQIYAGNFSAVSSGNNNLLSGVDIYAQASSGTTGFLRGLRVDVINSPPATVTSTTYAGRFFHQNAGTINAAVANTLALDFENSGSSNEIFGIYNTINNSGTVNGAIRGNQSSIINTGTLTGNLFGYSVGVSGVGSITGNSYGIYIDSLGNPTGDLFSFWANVGNARFAPSVSAYASINIPSGANPSSPNSGDLWWNGTNLNFRTGSSTVDLLAGGGANGSDGEIQFANGGNFDSSTDLFWDIGNSRLGIGTNTPSTTLQISGGMSSFAASSSSYASINIASGANPSSPNSGDLWWNGTNLYFFNGTSSVDLLAGGGGSPSGSDGELQFNDGGNFGANPELFWDNTGLNLGIGTGSPTYPLHIVREFNAVLTTQGGARIETSTNVANNATFFRNMYSSTTNAGTLVELTNFDLQTENTSDNISVITGINNRIDQSGNNSADIRSIFNEISLSGNSSNVYGNYTVINQGSGVVDSIYGNYIEASINEASYLYGMYFDLTGSQNVIQDAYGILINPMNRGQQNNYGLWIGGASGGASENWSIYVQAGNTYLGGDVEIVGNVNIGGVCSDSDGGDGGTDGCDIAESFTSDENLEKGDVVKLAPGVDGRDWKKITRSINSNDYAIGIISSNPTIVMGRNPKLGNAFPVGLSGVLPTKVTNQNGFIRRGDFVTVSDIAGHGMKANVGNLTLGIALEDQQKPQDIINILVNRNNLGSKSYESDISNINNKIADLENKIATLVNQINESNAQILLPGDITEEEEAELDQDTSNNSQEFIVKLESIFKFENSEITLAGRINLSELFVNILNVNSIRLGGSKSGSIELNPTENEKIVDVPTLGENSKIIITFVNSDSYRYRLEKQQNAFKIILLEENSGNVRIDYMILD